MFFKVFTVTLILFQITNQGKLKSSTASLMKYFTISDDYICHENRRNARQFEYFSKLFDFNNRIGGYEKPQSKTRFSDVMKYIISTPDYGLKYTEDYKPRMLEFPNFPGFHNLIEVRGPKLYKFIPNRLREYEIAQINKQNTKKMKTPYQITPDISEYPPKKVYQLDETSISKEGFSVWDISHESYKRSPASDLLKKMEYSSPIPNLNEPPHYITQALSMNAVVEMPKEAVTSSNPIVSLTARNFFAKIDALPYRQVQTRNQDPDSDEDDDYEISKYLEDY